MMRSKRLSLITEFRLTIKRALVGGTVLALTLTHFQAAAHDSWPTLLTMYAGESKVLKAPNVMRLSVGNTKIVSSTLLENGEIVLIGEAAGETNMQVWFSDGQRKTLPVVIVESNGWRQALEVRELLGDIEGIKISTVGRRIVVDGQIDTRDLDRVKLVKERYDGMLILARELTEFEQDMLHFDVRIVEIGRDVTEELGINWSTSFAGPSLGYEDIWSTNTLGRLPENDNASTPVGTLLADTMDPLSLLLGTDLDTEDEYSLADQRTLAAAQQRSYTFWGIGTSILSMINVLEANGAAMTLTNPRLSTRSGGKANLTVGGEVPVVTSSVSGTSVTYKDYGILLEIEPTLDRYDNLMARVSIEVSALDLSNAVDGQPAFKKRSSENDIKLIPGDTLALAGLIQREEQIAYSGIKWLSDIPGLGNLFRNKSFTEGETELVILITPTPIDDMQSGENKAMLEISEGILDEFNKAKEALAR